MGPPPQSWVDSRLRPFFFPFPALHSPEYGDQPAPVRDRRCGPASSGSVVVSDPRRVVVASYSTSPALLDDVAVGRSRRRRLSRHAGRYPTLVIEGAFQFEQQLALPIAGGVPSVSSVVRNFAILVLARNVAPLSSGDGQRRLQRKLAGFLQYHCSELIEKVQQRSKRGKYLQ